MHLVDKSAGSLARHHSAREKLFGLRYPNNSRKASVLAKPF